MLKLESGMLRRRITEQTQAALECGALQPIATEYELVEQDGIEFLVRILLNIARKEEANQQQEKKKNPDGKEFNPFLPYEEDLFVADISDTHLCLLNKYNVVEHHLLIITRAFAEQESYLNLEDFQALWACLAQVDGLAFYNGGQLAGASQRHKHLQLVPFPLTPTGISLPIEPAIASARFQGEIGTIPLFSFRHALMLLDSSWGNDTCAAAQATLEGYCQLLRSVGLEGEGEIQEGAYNLLITKKWILIIPRLQASFASIPVNSLGFAGAFLVKNEEQMKLLKQLTPLTILENVAVY
jgi:ATP adenylyltransferase